MEIRVQVDISDAMAALNNAVTPQAIQRGLMAAALVIEGGAKLNAPVDTGFLRNSIWSATAGDSGYNQAYSKAKERNPAATMLPQIGVGRLEAIIAVGAEYAYDIETLRTKTVTGVQPFMAPALESNRGRIGQIVRDAIADRRRA